MWTSLKDDSANVLHCFCITVLQAHLTLAYYWVNGAVLW